MKTKLRLFCIFLCLIVVNNTFADILTNNITLVGEYKGHKVYTINEGADKFGCISYSVVINGETVNRMGYVNNNYYVTHHYCPVKVDK